MTDKHIGYLEKDMAEIPVYFVRAPTTKRNGILIRIDDRETSHEIIFTNVRDILVHMPGYRYRPTPLKSYPFSWAVEQLVKGISVAALKDDYYLWTEDMQYWLIIEQDVHSSYVIRSCEGQISNEEKYRISLTTAIKRRWVAYTAGVQL